MEKTYTIEWYNDQMPPPGEYLVTVKIPAYRGPQFDRYKVTLATCYYDEHNRARWRSMPGIVTRWAEKPKPYK